MTKGSDLKSNLTKNCEGIETLRNFLLVILN